MEDIHNIVKDGRIILVVEDENPLLQVISAKFTKKGFTVLQATNGAEGLTLAIENRPNLILLDIAMPQMDGFTMLHKLREDIWGKFASVIILTNLDVNDERLEKVVAEQPSYYFIKSNTTLEQILEKAEEILHMQKEKIQQIFNSQKVEEKSE